MKANRILIFGEKQPQNYSLKDTVITTPELILTHNKLS